MKQPSPLITLNFVAYYKWYKKRDFEYFTHPQIQVINMRVSLQKYQKFYSHIISFKGLKTLGTFIKFLLIGSKLIVLSLMMSWPLNNKKIWRRVQ